MVWFYTPPSLRVLLQSLNLGRARHSCALATRFDSTEDLISDKKLIKVSADTYYSCITSARNADRQTEFQWSGVSTRRFFLWQGLEQEYRAIVRSALTARYYQPFDVWQAHKCSEWPLTDDWERKLNACIAITPPTPHACTQSRPLGSISFELRWLL